MTSQTWKIEKEGVVTLLPSDTKQKIEFTPVAHWWTSSERKNAHHWTELHVWETVGDQLVLANVGQTTIEGQSVRCSVKVFKYDEDLVAELGYTKLSKRLYVQMGIEDIVIR